MPTKTILPVVWAFSDNKTHKKITFEKNVRVVYSNDKSLVFVVYTDKTTTPPVFDHVLLPNGKLIHLGTNDPKRKALSVIIEDGFFNRKTREVSRKDSSKFEIMKNYKGYDIVYINDIAMPDITPTDVIEIEGRTGKQLYNVYKKKDTTD